MSFTVRKQIDKNDMYRIFYDKEGTSLSIEWSLRTCEKVYRAIKSGTSLRTGGVSSFSLKKKEICFRTITHIHTCSVTIPINEFIPVLDQVMRMAKGVSLEKKSD